MRLSPAGTWIEFFVPVDIEWVHPDVGIIRAGEHLKSYGDDYQASAVVTIMRGVGIVSGFIAHDSYHFTTRDFRQTRRLILSRPGVHHLTWDRYKDGKRKGSTMEDYVKFTMTRGRGSKVMQELTCLQTGSDADMDKLQEASVKTAMEMGFQDLAAKRERKGE